MALQRRIFEKFLLSADEKTVEWIATTMMHNNPHHRTTMFDVAFSYYISILPKEETDLDVVLRFQKCPLCFKIILDNHYETKHCLTCGKYYCINCTTLSTKRCVTPDCRDGVITCTSCIKHDRCQICSTKCDHCDMEQWQDMSRKIEYGYNFSYKAHRDCDDEVRDMQQMPFYDV